MMNHLRLRDLGAVVILLLSAAGPAKPQNPGAAAEKDGIASAFTFRVTAATVTREGQNFLSGVKLDSQTGTFSILTSLLEPKDGRVFVLLKVTVRNDGVHTDRVVSRDLVIRADGQPIPYKVLVDKFPTDDPQRSSVPMYIDFTATRDLAPSASQAEDLLLSVPSGLRAMTLQYRSLPAIPIDVVVPSRFKQWPGWCYLAFTAVGILVIGAIVWLVARRRNSPEDSSGKLGLT
jgi:hypothetical protein